VGGRRAHGEPCGGQEVIAPAAWKLGYDAATGSGHSFVIPAKAGIQGFPLLCDLAAKLRAGRLRRDGYGHGFVIPAQAGIQGFPLLCDLAAKLRVGRLRRDGYAHGFVIPAKAGIQGFPLLCDLAAKLRVGELRRDGYGVRRAASQPLPDSLRRALFAPQPAHAQLCRHMVGTPPVVRHFFTATPRPGRARRCHEVLENQEALDPRLRGDDEPMGVGT
jgi:hypothetical protein